MRRFATWTTGHRKTVILGWIVALIVVGMIAGSVGSDFTEEFKLPSSDSQEAFDLLEHKFPQQSGVTAEIVYKAPAGADSAAVKKKMEGVFAEAEKLPHVSEVASPYEAGGRGRDQQGRRNRLRDRPVRRHHRQARKETTSRS